MAEPISRRYELLERVGEDFVSEEFRAKDLENDAVVAVRWLKPDVCRRSTESLYRYRQLQRGLSAVRHPDVCNVVASGEWQERDYVVEEWSNGQVMARSVSGAIDVPAAVQAVYAIARGLDSVHQQGILHGFLNPESVVLDASAPEHSAKIRNFGAGLLVDLTRVRNKEDVRRVFGYLAPEQSGILRKPADARSDIYGLGILFYQMLTGAPPYQSDDVNDLISEHISREPKPPAQINPRIPAVLERVVLKLIAKDPADRYQSLAGLIADLQEFIARKRAGDENTDFEIGRKDRVRELSFATRIIGRDDQLRQLRELVEKARHNIGGLCFIHGEPGIGKTRLINELRADVHRMGGLFVGGKCYQYESGTPFKALSGALDAYVEKVRRLNLGDQKRRFRRLRQTVGELGAEPMKLTPRLRELLGDVPALAELEPDKERVRFLVTTVGFLAELGEPESPLVMFLEDLQWSDEGTIELLERLAPKLSDKPLLLVVSYRSNEVGSEHSLTRLRERLEAAAIPFGDFRVSAFSLAQAEQMIAAILMEPPEEITELAKFLHARTQGNPFFILEILRTLVEENVIRLEEGRFRYVLRELEAVKLPENIVEAVLRRLKDIPDADMKVLSFAAVIGKTVDLELLADLAGQDLEQLLANIETGVRHQVLTRDLVDDGSVQFVHDRVREALYRRVRDDEAAQLHSRIARSLERRGDSEAQSNRGVLVYDLAYHYGKANDADKALLYCRKAGQMAAQASAHGLAVTLYEQARAILEKQNRAQTEEYGVVLEELGEVYRISGRFDQAIEALRKCLSLVPEKDIVHQALVLAKMGDACFENGEPGKAANLIERGLRRLGASLPEKKWGVRLAIAWEFLKQLTHIARPEWMTRRFREASLSDLTRIRLRSRLFYIYYFNDMDRAFYVYLSNLNLCENRAPSKVLASQYVLGGPVWVSFPWVWKALRDLNRGLRLAKQFSDTLQEARLLTHFAFVMRVDNRPKEGLEYCRQAIHALRGLGEYFDLGVAFVFRNHCNWMGNTPFTEALRQNAEFMSVARDTHLLQPLGWSMINQGIYAAFHGEWPEDAVPIVRKGVEMLVKIKDLPDIVYGHAFEAMLHLRYGRLDDALASARQVEKLLPTHEMKASWIQELFPICAEVYLEAIATRPDAEPSAMAEYWRGAERFCRESRWRARRFNYIQGWSCQVNGTLWWLKGRRNRAERWWNEGIEFLGRKPSTYRLANLLLESGRRRLGVDPTDLKARERILEARDLFEKLDAPKDLKTASALLERTAERGGEVDSRNALTFKRHLDSLLSVTQVIGSVFDARELLEKIVDYAMKVTGAQRGFILLTGAANEPLELRVQRGVDASTLNSPFSYGTYGVSLGLVEAVRQKREASISSAQDAGEIAAELKSCGVRQAMAVLLSTKAKDLGVLYLDNHLADGMFGAEELELMKSFGVQAAVAIENTRLVQSLVEQDRLKQELRLGREIQSGFLPKEAPSVPGLKVAAIMEPAREIGGDYYDYIRRRGRGGESVAFALGDVTGKGVGAGLHMALVKTALLTLSQEPIGLRDILVKANRILHGQMSAGTFITLLFLEWRPGEGALSFSGAGHGPFLVYRGRTQSVEPIATGGTALGLIPEVDGRIQERSIELAPGDKAILFTDGLTEAANSNEAEFGLEGLSASVSRHGELAPAELIQAIRKDVAAFTGPGEPNDDMTLMVLERSAS